MMNKFKLKTLWSILKKSVEGFIVHKVPRLSASLAFYTIFSLGPMMLVILFFSTFFWKRQAIEGIIYRNLSGVIGESAALQIQDIIKNAALTGSQFTIALSFIILIISATTVFTEMQTSMNVIWDLRIKKRRGWGRMLRSKLLSFSIVAGLGFLLLVSLIINGLLEGFMGKLQEMFPHTMIVMVYIIQLIITLLVVASLFALIFKVLPHAVIRWKDVIPGSLFAAVLFMAGKFLISLYINKTDFGTSYGAAGSIIILLLWIYYSSVILYFGAEFTKAYALRFGAEIIPKEYAVTIKVVEVESGATTLQQNESIDSKELFKT